MFAAQGLIVQETRSSAHLTELATLWQTLSEVNQTSAKFRPTPLINWFRQFNKLYIIIIAGSKNSPYLRLLPPAYGDGIILPRHFPFFKNQSHRWLFYFQGRKFSCEPWPGIPELPSLPSSHIGHDHEVFSILSIKFLQSNYLFFISNMSRIFLQGGRPERDGEQDQHPHGDAVGSGEDIRQRCRLNICRYIGCNDRYSTCHFNQYLQILRRQYCHR